MRVASSPMYGLLDLVVRNGSYYGGGDSSKALQQQVYCENEIVDLEREQEGSLDYAVVETESTPQRDRAAPRLDQQMLREISARLDRLDKRVDRVEEQQKTDKKLSSDADQIKKPRVREEKHRVKEDQFKKLMEVNAALLHDAL